MKTKLVKIAPEHVNRSDIFGQNTFSVETEAALVSAANIIKSGGLVIFPTETVYGLGGDATNPEAARKIYEAKGRPSDNPLIIHISSPEEAEKYAHTTELYYKLADRFMPGPLTVIMDSREIIPEATRGGLKTVAVRCPENPIARELIRLSQTAIAAPSANLSGSPSPTKAEHVIDDMLGRVDMIIDGGDCDFGLESTIVKIEGEDKLCLLRPGKITVADLSDIADVEIAGAVMSELKAGETALSPGMKYRHYAPKSPMVLLDGNSEEIINYIENSGQSNAAVIIYSEDKEHFEKVIPRVPLYSIGSRSDKVAQAHALFSLLREIDKQQYDIIYAPLPSDDGIGLALYNRLIRAAAHTIINLRR